MKAYKCILQPLVGYPDSLKDNSPSTGAQRTCRVPVSSACYILTTDNITMLIDVEYINDAPLQTNMADTATVVAVAEETLQTV